MFFQSMTQIKHDCVHQGKDIDTHVTKNTDTIVLMKTYGERVRERREEIGMTQAQLARAIGAKFPSTIGNIENRSGESRFTIELAKALNVRPEWLKTGKEPKELDQFGPAIETPLRPVVVVESPEDIKHEIIEVPRYTLKASAGTGQPVLEIDREGTPNYCRAGWARENGYKPDQLFSMRMCGTSMLPTIPDGASLIVHRQQEVEPGRVHIICRDGECFVKRLYKQMDGSLLIHSDNEKVYKDILLQPGDPLELYVVGVVVTFSANL